MSAISVTDPVRWARTRYLLAGVVADDPACAAEAHALVEIVSTLDLLASLAPGSLGGSPWDAQVFQAVLQRWTGSALDPRRVGELVRGERASGNVADEDGLLLSTSALTMTGLAAMRVGAPAGLEREYLAAVFGLALAAGRAESISRIFATPRSELAAARAQLTSQEGRDGDFPVLQALTDATERRRWLRLVDLFGDLAAEGVGVKEDLLDDPVGAPLPAWLGVEPRLQLGTLPPVIEAGELVISTEPGAWPTDHRVHVVLASPPALLESEPQAILVRAKVNQGRGVATIVVPEGLRPGWIGLSSPQHVQSANRGRSELRSRLGRRWVPRARLHDTLPELTLARSLPPWPLSRPFEGGVPEVVMAQLDASGGSTRLRWATRGADQVKITGLDGLLPACGEVLAPALDVLLIEPARGLPRGVLRGPQVRVERASIRRET